MRYFKINHEHPLDWIDKDSFVVIAKERKKPQVDLPRVFTVTQIADKT
jgi:hypothetical protein